MDQIVNRPEAETPDGIKSALGLDTQSGRKRGRRGIYLLAILVVAAAAIAVYLRLSGGAAETVYTTTTVERGSMTVQVSATGTLQPRTQVDISSELSGVIRSVPVEENQRVAKGDVLAELDTTRLAAQVERAEASVKAAAANVNEAKVTLAETSRALARSEQLASRGMIADQALETARAARDRAASAVETAEANLAVAEADLKLQQADLVKSKIYAPVDGIVLSRDADPGQTVASSFQAPILFVIAEDLTRMELVAAIDEADIGTVAKGQDAEFTVDAFPGRRFEAAISDISYASTATEGVVTYEARLAVDNEDLLLRPGMTATVSIVTRHAENVLLVPNEAFRYSPPAAEESRSFGISNLFTGRFGGRRGWRGNSGQRENASDGMRTLYVLREGQPEAVRVKTGASDGMETEILSGLEEGDRIITASASRNATASVRRP
ncbi:HlyD family secretion protein [Mesorhizobium sp. J18]|uniref:efflux RND transporter periplasmic adaptor subunit n=1 Tax=Mesorhizobium sp. J18 TaxID=935263 RepID=UPI00119B18C7|nr:efflux RND transporter periplasmic adaptor subunit [Mesorhizobium sp. J18]TWH01100.1 HlyD family secretion protein [Mesorhizobium sp. J18]